MPRLLVSPGHQQPCYCLCMINVCRRRGRVLTADAISLGISTVLDIKQLYTPWNKCSMRSDVTCASLCLKSVVQDLMKLTEKNHESFASMALRENSQDSLTKGQQFGKCSHGPLTRYVILRVAHGLSFLRHRLQRKPLCSDPGMHHGTCVTHVSWCMSGSLTRGGRENIPGILGACATRNFTYLARGPCHDLPVRNVGTCTYV